MCAFKVADRRNSGKSPPSARDKGIYGLGNNALESMLGPIYLGHNREEEMAVMVSALTHVVSGGDGGGGSEGDPMAGYMWDGGGVGEKRGRGEEIDDISIGLYNNIRGEVSLSCI